MELSLISDSAAHAAAKIKQFRLGFGLASGKVQVSADELGALLSDVYGGNPISLNWAAQGTYSRSVGQMVVLAAMCAERALPYGGTIEIYETVGKWCVIAKSERVKTDQALWDLLLGNDPAPDFAPADVQFALLPRVAASAGISCSYKSHPAEVHLIF